MNSVVILVIVLATANGYKTGAASVVVPFATEAQCLYAGNTLVKQAEQRRNYVLTWGCFAGGVK